MVVEAVEGTLEVEVEVELEAADCSEQIEIALADETYDEPPTAELSLQAQLGALLFASMRPLAFEDLVETTRASASEVEAALKEFTESLLNAQLGFTLCEVSGGYQIRTLPEAGKLIARIAPPKVRRLSRAAAETLAVIAYRQPVQKAEIEAIRGVDVLPTLKTLLEAKLIRVVGHEDTVGRPGLYGTTNLFLEKFGLKDLSDLPNIRELERMDAEPGEGGDQELSSEKMESSEEVTEETSLVAEAAVSEQESIVINDGAAHA